MAVICIGQRIIFKAVSFYTTIFHTHFSITTRAQFAVWQYAVDVNLEISKNKDMKRKYFASAIDLT